MSLTSGAGLRPKSAISSAAGVTVTFQPWRANHSPTGSRSSKYHSSSVRGMSRSGSTLAISWRSRSIRSRRLARISSSRNVGPSASTATRLPGAASPLMRSNSRSCAAAGRYGISPSADQTLGCDGSKPASCNAFGQSWRRSTATSTRLAAGCAPCSVSVDSLKSSTRSWSSS